MADERSRTKSELKNLFTNLSKKSISEDMISILIDTLWRDNASQRSNGFEFAGGQYSEISFDAATRLFTIAPFDPVVANYIPRYAFYSFNGSATFHRVYYPLSIEIPDEEGLYLIYFDTEPYPGRSQVFTILKNPDTAQIQNIIQTKVSIASIYWDAIAGEALYFGNDRHGSEYNPFIHWYLHKVFNARRESGLQLTDLQINEDGTADSHAQFTVTAGVMMHDDITITIPSFVNSIPILFFLDGLPRFLSNGTFAVYNTNGRILYNSGTVSALEASEGYHVMSHIFAVNEHVNATRKVISVMGQNEYETLAEAYVAVESELDTIYSLMPHQGRCYLGTLVYQTSSAYTNAVKGRIVAHIGSAVSHPPLTIAPGSEAYLSLTASQQLAINTDLLGGIGEPGSDGLDGKSAYEIAVENGFVGTEPEWLTSLTADSHPPVTIHLDSAALASIDPVTQVLTVEQQALPQVNSDWNAVSGVSEILNKPSIPAAQIQSDWNQASSGALDFIKNKPGIPTVLSSKSVSGDGSVGTPLVLLNDETTPTAFKYYGTNNAGVKGWHLLPFSGDNVYVVYNETELLAAYADAITFVGKSATIYIGGTVTFTASRSFLRSNTDSKITFWGIGLQQAFYIQNTTFSINNITCRNIMFQTNGQVYVTVNGHYASFYDCWWFSEVAYNASVINMKIAIRTLGGITNGTGGIIVDGMRHASSYDVSLNSAGDVQPFIIQNTVTWPTSHNLYVSLIRFEAVSSFDRFSRVLLLGTAPVTYRVTGDLSWYYHPTQEMPGIGFINSTSLLLKRGSVDDLRGDFIPSGSVVKYLGIDSNNRIIKAASEGTGETAITMGSLFNLSTGKTTPVDADMVGLMDSEETNLLKKLSWANIKATLKSYFDTLYNNYTHPANHPPSIIAQDSSNRFITDAERIEWTAKQAALASGISLKTINGTSLLGGGNIDLSETPNGGATSAQLLTISTLKL